MVTTDAAPPPDLPESSESDLERSKLREGIVSEGSKAQILDLKKGDKTWVGVAQDKKSLRKHEVEILTTEGKHRVEIPSELLKDSTLLWEDFVAGKFLDLAPHIAKVHMVVNKIWRYGDTEAKVDVIDVNATTMRFKVTNPKAREKILRRGMWNIAGVPMVVSKWSPTTEAEKQEEEAIPMWVHLKNVPISRYSWEALSYMTSTVGHPVKLHPDTIACTDFEVAKVFVNVDVTKMLPKEITFLEEGKEYTVGFHYTWLPMRCNLCDKWGHGEKVCLTRGRGKKHKEVGSSETVAEKSGEKKEGASVDLEKKNEVA